MKESEGQLQGDNIVLYPDCFTDVRATIRYTYTVSGFEQDVVWETQPPAPETFGLDPKTTRLQVLTEFVDAPAPAKISRSAGGLADETLDFGPMSIGSGKAFSVDAVGDSTSETPVAKEWTPLDGRTFLIEEVPYEQVIDQLQKLPDTQEYKGASLQRRGKGENVIAGLKALLPKRYARVAPKPGAKPMAKGPRDFAQGFVMDYLVTLAGQANATLRGDTTYYVSGTVNLTGTTTIEGGTILKYTNSTSAKISMSGALICQTAPYRPAVLTSKDDNTLGEIIPGSTGNPSNSNGGTYLSISGYPTYKYLRFSYAGIAIDGGFGTATTGGVWHCQFVRCGTCLLPDDDDGYLYDVLFSKCGTVIALGADNVKGSHVTADQINTFYASFHSVTLTNSLLTAVTNLGYGVTLVNSVTNASGNGIYQTVGAGSYYLAAGSTNRNAGTPNLNPALLSDLSRRTTYPPVEISTNFTANTTLGPQAQRDTDTPDLGYHYDPLDYVVSGRTLTNATLTLTNGVALGTYGAATSYGIYIRKGGNLVSEGTADRLNQIGRYNTSQEQATTNWSATTVAHSVKISTDGATKPAGSFRFTGWSLLGGKGYHFFADYPGITTPFGFQDCQFGPGAVYAAQCSVALTNCLLERPNLNLDDDGGNYGYYGFNNLFRAGTVTLNRNGSTAWLCKDNLFDQSTISATASLTHGNNGYVTNANRLSPNQATDKILTNAPIYQTSFLGNYYYPTNGGLLSTLLNAGSRSATNAGLYHYTVTTNQVQETNSTVDIGFHYVAEDTKGVLIDSNGDGLSDYLQDRNGNGVYDSPDPSDFNSPDTDGDGMPNLWEVQNGLNPLVDDANDDPDGDWLTNFQEYNGGTNSSNPHDVLVVAWGRNNSAQCNVPTGLRDVVAIAAGRDFSLALRKDGSVVGWGANDHGQTNVPANLTNATALAAGPYHGIGLKADGTPSVWGTWFPNSSTYSAVSLTSGLTSIAAIAAGEDHDLVLHSNGTMQAWGYDANASYVQVPANLPPAKAIAAGWRHSVAVTITGDVVAWGENYGGDFGWNLTTVPTGLNNVLTVAAGAFHTLALQANGTVTAWGAGQTDGTVFFYGQSVVPGGLSNVVAVAAGGITVWP